MGIKSFYEAIKKKGIAYIDSYRLSDPNFQGTYMAIDSEYLFTQYIYGALCETIRQSQEIYIDHNPNREAMFFNWVINVIGFLRKCQKFKITPILILEGPPPELKMSTKEKRVKDAKDREDKIMNIRNQLRDLSPFDTNYVKLCEDLNKALSCGRYSQEEKFKLINILKFMGFNWLQSTTEGEKLCSMLATHEYVQMVYSTDTDNLTYGCPFMVTKFVKDNIIEVVRLERIKEILGIDSQEQFVEYCIMCGTDYNKNIPNIGSGRALPLILQYGTLDNLSQEKDTSILNYQEVKKIFMSIHPQEISEQGVLLNGKRDDNSLMNYLASINQEGLIQYTNGTMKINTDTYQNSIEDIDIFSM